MKCLVEALRRLIDTPHEFCYVKIQYLFSSTRCHNRRLISSTHACLCGKDLCCACATDSLGNKENNGQVKRVWRSMEIRITSAVSLICDTTPYAWPLSV